MKFWTHGYVLYCPVCYVAVPGIAKPKEKVVELHHPPYRQCVYDDKKWTTKMIEVDLEMQ